MTDAQRGQFKADGENWRPEDQSVPVVCVFPDDIIFMQPGHDNVHGPITFETCYMRGGNCWDDRKLPEILAQIVDQSQSRNISNEHLPGDLRGVINALWFSNCELQTQCERVLRQFTFCTCDSLCLTNACSCKKRGFDCTHACHEENTKCKNRSSSVVS
jgi:hypothetical protein